MNLIMFGVFTSFRGNNFHPFREVIRYGQDEAVSSECWRADGSNNIHSPHLKCLWRGCWMNMSWCLMEKITIDLTCMASLSIGDGVNDHLQPIVTKSSKPVSELKSRLVSSAYTVMSVLSASCASLYEKYRSSIPSYDRRYNVCMIALGLSFWWQQPPWDGQAICNIRRSRCKVIANL